MTPDESNSTIAAQFAMAATATAVKPGDLTNDRAANRRSLVTANRSERPCPSHTTGSLRNYFPERRPVLPFVQADPEVYCVANPTKFSADLLERLDVIG